MPDEQFLLQQIKQSLGHNPAFAVYALRIPCLQLRPFPFHGLV
jgi:hypothetical protein